MNLKDSEVQFNLLNSTAYYRYLSQRIGAIVETTLTALKYQGSYSEFKPQRFEASFRKNPRNPEDLQAMPLITEQGIPINIRGQIDRYVSIRSICPRILIGMPCSVINGIACKSSGFLGFFLKLASNL